MAGRARTLRRRWSSRVLFCSVLLASTASAQQLPQLFRRPPLQPSDLCMSNEDRERIRVILLAAVDDALKDQVVHLFEVWMRDFKDQPDRAAQGTRNAIYAYLRAREAVATWNPQPCK